MQVMPRESWTDERLDDFRVEVNRRFDEQRAESLAIRKEVKEGFERVDKRFERVDKRFEGVTEQFERMYRLMITIGVAIVLAVLSNHL